MAGLKIITPPAIEPVTLEEAKLHLRVDGEDEDSLISNLIVAAREWCESYQNRAYVTQVLELALDRWPYGDTIELPRAPLQSVVKIEYIDDVDLEMLDVDRYTVDDYAFVGRVVLNPGARWPAARLPAANGVRVLYVAGYGDAAADVPQRVKQAILLLVGHWYDRREAVLTGSISKEIEFAVSALLDVDRVVPI